MDRLAARSQKNPIALCVAEFSLVPSSRIWKQQNFLAISCWCVPMGWKLPGICLIHIAEFASQVQAPVSENPLVSQVVDEQFQLPILIAHQWPEHNDSECRFNIVESHAIKPKIRLCYLIRRRSILRRTIWRIQHVSLTLLG
jgi:hypothetical protein